MPVWNPWHGCHKYSEGCLNCYMYRRDESIGKDPSIITKTQSFNLPIKRKRSGDYKIPSGSEVFICMTSDFFIEETDEYRGEIWSMVKQRNDLTFFIITKRIVRFLECIPNDWGTGYPNVVIGCTMENQKQVDNRLPILRDVPIQHKFIVCEPLLEYVNLEPLLDTWAEFVIIGGESGPKARVCDYEWVLDIRKQCISKGVPFRFKQTGANFKKDGHIFKIPRKYQHTQAKKANINTLEW